MSGTALAVRQLSKSFGRQVVLNDLTFDVHAGEFFVIYGPSGTGKTTLLKAIAGLLPVDAGEVLLNGRPITDLPPERRGVAMTFQTFALYPHLTAFDNIANPLRSPRLRLDPRTITDRVHAVAELLRITHVLDHRPAELSGGEKQRVALARSIVRPAEVLLLDDPLRNVDAKIRHQMRAELPHLVGHLKTTILYVTQDYREALALGHRIAVLQGGRFVQVGTPADIYTDPLNAFVARSFGEPPINLLPGRVVAGTRLDLGFWETPLVESADLPDNAPVLVGIRPHDVTVVPDETPATFPATVVAFEPLGAKAALVTEAEGGGRVTATVSAETPHRFGDVVRLTVNTSRILLFDPETGLRIPRASTRSTHQWRK
jgi:multiple sugar transport system ATP-binding protein